MKQTPPKIYATLYFIFKMGYICTFSTVHYALPTVKYGWWDRGGTGVCQHFGFVLRAICHVLLSVSTFAAT